MKLSVLPTVTDLAVAAADNFIDVALDAIRARGQFTVALTGGTTPRETYALLATEPFASRIDWPRVQVFWGDERCVPPGDAASNYRMAREALLDHVPIPADNVHRMRGEDEPLSTAAAYEQTIDEIVGERFDLVHLGMGADAHIASLFAGTAALHEEAKRVCAHFVGAVGMWRITLTPVAILAADHITMIVSGSGKAAAVAQVLEGPQDPDVSPAQIVLSSPGRVLFLVDADAAGLLKHV